MVVPHDNPTTTTTLSCCTQSHDVFYCRALGARIAAVPHYSVVFGARDPGAAADSGFQLAGRVVGAQVRAAGGDSWGNGCYDSHENQVGCQWHAGLCWGKRQRGCDAGIGVAWLHAGHTISQTGSGL